MIIVIEEFSLNTQNTHTHTPHTQARTQYVQVKFKKGENS